MASDYRSSPFLHSSFNSYKSTAFGAPRTGSLRLKAREAPIKNHYNPSSSTSSVQRLKCTEHELNTVNLLKSIAATQAQKTAVSANPKPVTSPLGSNKSYYSSTRSFSSKIVERSKLPPAQQPKAPASKSSGQQSVASSSGTSSVESIVPKYNGFMNGSKKRIYSSVRITKKELPYTAISTMPTSVFISSAKFTANKKQVKDAESRPDETNKAAVFSTKFPNGMPFEDEFYHKRRNSISAKSEVSDYGSFENDESDRSLLPFEDEFTRQRPSNEPLYVDFSKRFSPLAKAAGRHRGNKEHCARAGNRNAGRNYVCSPNKVIVQDQPVVYVAVKWWASEGNHDCCSDPIRSNVV